MTAGASLAVVAVLTGTLLLPGVGGDRTLEPVAPPNGPTTAGVTYAVGDTLYLDGGAETVRLPDREVTALGYTSAGVVAVHLPAGSASDVAQTVTLVRPDGTTTEIAAKVGDDGAFGVEPDQPYLAVAEPVYGGIEVVVRDLEADEEVARVPVPGSFSEYPPSVGLDGDTVYVDGLSGFPPRLTAVDWRTGEVIEGDGPPFGGPEVAGGRTVAVTLTGPRVLDVSTGERLHVPPQAAADGSAIDVGISLSPDGRYAETAAFSRSDGSRTTQLVDLDTDEPLDVRVPPDVEVGWSAFDQPFWVDAEGVVTVCDPVTGDCVDEQRPELLGGESDDVLLGGLPYGP